MSAALLVAFAVQATTIDETGGPGTAALGADLTWLQDVTPPGRPSRSGQTSPTPRSSPVRAPDPNRAPAPDSAPDPIPAPEPEPSSSPNHERPPLIANFERGLSNWNTAGAGDEVPTVVSDTAREGIRAATVTLNGSQERSELILGGNGTGSTTGTERFGEGEEGYYGFSFLVRSMVYGRPGAHNLIMQFKSDGEGSPSFGLALWDYAGDDGTSGGRGLWTHGTAMGGDRFLSPIAHNEWHDIVIHFEASRTGQGSYELYLDGDLVDSRRGVSMIRPDRSYAYIKNGLYRNGGEIPGTSELRFDNARLGKSMAQVSSP